MRFFKTKNIGKILRFGLLKRFHKGDSLLLFLTFKCTLHCDYCALKYIGKYPQSETMDLAAWKRIVTSFPRKVREIKITGGEPMLMPYYVEFVNWALSEGYFVTVITNLSLWKYVQPHLHLRFIATYHRAVDPEKFKKMLAIYRRFYRVDVDEIETEKIPTSKNKAMCYREYGDTCRGFLYAPDGKLYTIVNELYEAHQ